MWACAAASIGFPRRTLTTRSLVRPGSTVTFARPLDSGSPRPGPARHRRDDLAASPGQPRHHGADRPAGHFRDLAIREALYLAQNECLPWYHRQCRDRLLKECRLGFGDQRRLWRFDRRRGGQIKRDAFEILDEDQFGLAVLPQPLIGGVPNDGQNPCAGITVG